MLDGQYLANGVIHCVMGHARADRREIAFQAARRVCQFHDGADRTGFPELEGPHHIHLLHGMLQDDHIEVRILAPDPCRPWLGVGDELPELFQGRVQSDQVTFERFPQGTDHRLAFWLIHIFLPLYFTLEGRYEFIHASSVDIAEHTVLFTSPSHGGKSTLTDYFVQQGHALVSDDKVGTYREGEQYFAVPSHPGRRPFRKFEELGYRTENFSPRRRNIHALYNLYAVEPAADVQIEEIRGHQGFTQVLPNYLFNFRFLQARRLQYLGAMLGVVPVFRVAVPWDLDRLADVYWAICDHRGGVRSV